MRKMFITVLISLFFMMMCISIAGCNSKEGTIYQSDTNEINEHELSNSKSVYNSLDITDYNQYLKTIWVESNWDGDTYDDRFSFYISKIDNGLIEGKISVELIAEPYFYFYSFNPARELWDFSGTINNEIAKGIFYDENEKKISISIQLINKEKLEVEINYLGEKKKVFFRPYNLSDIKNIQLIEEHTFLVNLNSWGNVYFVTAEISGNKPHPIVFLTDSEGNIFYHFNAAFHIGSHIMNASVEDINKDGLHDIEIVTGFDDLEIESIEWTFLQTENGLFYDNGLDGEQGD